MMEMDLVVVYDNLPALIEANPSATDLGIEETLTAIQNDAQANAPEGETGALKASAFHISRYNNTFAQAAAAVSSLGQHGSYAIQEPAVDTAAGGAAVGFAANYAMPVHDGHHTASGSFVEGNPFLQNALDNHGDDFANNIVQHIEEAAAGGAGISFLASGASAIKAWASGLLSKLGSIRK